MNLAPSQARACVQKRTWATEVAGPTALVILTSMLKETLEEGRKLADSALERLLPVPEERPASIHRAMRHSVFAGGKRIRPILCMEARRAVGGSLPARIEEDRAALEMLYAYY